MGSRLDVRPDAYFEAAQIVIGDALPPAHGAALRLTGVLHGCGAMAGSDPVGLRWARDYDEAADLVVSATQSVLTGTYRLGVLLEHTGVNHERAGVASTPGAAMPDLQVTHDPDWRVHLASPPPAAGGSDAGPPIGWALIKHLVGYVWPDGHQERLHAAADVWEAAAAGVEKATGQLPLANVTIAIVESLEVDDAIAALSAMPEHHLDLARAHRSLARACRALTHHIDSLHSEVESELVELMAWTAGIELVGQLASFFTLGIAEGTTAAAVAARVAVTVNAVKGLFQTFRLAVIAALETVPVAARAAEQINVALESILGMRVVTAEVTGVRALAMESRGARVTREAQAQNKLAHAANTVDKQTSPVWRKLKPFRGKTKTNGLTGKRQRFYQWDHTHHDIEVYDRSRRHLGSMDAATGEMTKGPEIGRKLGDD